ncbi:MAG TPA: hypothetical protein VFY77_00015 [Nitrososphaeraceae archaeon]|nr:hypothetical protein [Nitrososphaeraceae archaeon]
MSINLLWYCRVKAKNVSFELFKKKSLKNYSSKLMVIQTFSLKTATKEEKAIKIMLKIDCQFSVTNKIKFFCGMIGQESINDIIPT